MKKQANKKTKKSTDFQIMDRCRYSIDGIYVGKSVLAGGRGVFAARDFREGDIIELSPSIKVDKNPDALTYTNMCNYVFSNTNRDMDDNAYVGLGYTSLYNHREIPNAVFDVMDTIIIITAVKRIYEGEEIFVSYGWDTDKLDFGNSKK
jgi:SET domain-containing protein